MKRRYMDHNEMHKRKSSSPGCLFLAQTQMPYPVFSCPPQAQLAEMVLYIPLMSTVAIGLCDTLAKTEVGKFCTVCCY
jgi:hypothetical protein